METQKNYDLIIVGAGVAGLSAALYARRANKRVLLLESGFAGGVCVTLGRIDNYPALKSVSGYELIANLTEQLSVYGLSPSGFGAEKIDVDALCVATSKGEFFAKGIILAMGASNKKLGLSGEDRLVGRGLSYCASCDGFLFKGKSVAVVGSNAKSADEARYLQELASKVYYINSKSDVSNEGFLENVEVIPAARAAGFGLDGKGNIESLTVLDSGGKARELAVSAVFSSVGYLPNSALVFGKVDTDESGYIKTDIHMRTRAKMVYAAGDIRAGSVKQLVTAAADGATAVCAFLRDARG